MSSRAKVRWISYGCALAVCLVGVLAAAFAGANRYEARINADTARALSGAVDSVTALHVSLEKSACALTPAMQNTICMEICSNAKQAETALSVLPVRSDSLEEIAKHISVVGDYAGMLSRSCATGHAFMPEELQILSHFSLTTSELNGALVELQRLIASGSVSNEVFTRITDSLDNLEADASQSADTMEARMMDLADSFPDVPALIYDGVYTDRSDSKPLMLENRAEISKDKASQIAADWIGCAPEALKYQGMIDGEIAAYCFTGEQEGETFQIAVTYQGGEVLWLQVDASEGDASCDLDEAVSRGQAYLASRGMEDLEPTSCSVSGGEAHIRFAAVQDDVLCLADRIDLTVSLTTGRIVSYQAEAYLRNHTTRDATVFAEHPEQLSLPIPGFLEVKSIQKVILPAIGTEERFCYCVVCEDKNDMPYQIYINAVTGEQEEIMLPEELEGQL